jgi:hypothetical protein
MVKPILTYLSEMWGYNTCRQIENVHISFCKRIACLNQNLASFFALSKCGRLPISVTYMSKCVKHCLKLTEMPQYRLSRQCYIMLRNLDEHGRNPWATHVKRMLFQLGLCYAWSAKKVGNVNTFTQVFRTAVGKR